MPAIDTGAMTAGLPERRRAGRGRRIRILLVEDDGDIRLMLTLALEREGHDVTGVDSADEALDVMRQRRFDLILTDYCLPRKDGLALVAEARSTGLLAKAPVIVCTAFPPVRPTDLTVVEKPVDLDALMRQIRKLLGR